MDTSAGILINIEGNAYADIEHLEAGFTALTGQVDKLDNTVTTAFGTMQKEAKKANDSLAFLTYNAFAEMAQVGGQAWQSNVQGVYDFNYNLKELEAITGVAGAGLDDIGGRARNLSKDFGGSAAKALRSYTILLSKLTPEIAKNPEALGMMGEQVKVLSMGMQGDGVGAVNALSSAMNQFNIDLSDPLKAAKEAEVLMNQMAAGALVGSVEIPAITQALEQAGATAHKANVSFAETNAAIQVLGKYGKEGAEGGTALRNVMGIMARQDFLPERIQEELEDAGVNVDILADKGRSLAARLEELKKIGGDDALLAGMFGTENIVAITGLLQSSDLLRQYTKDIEANKTAARDMAAVLAESYQESRNRITAYFDDIKLSMFSFTGDLLPFVDVTVDSMLSIVQIMPGIMATAKAFQVLAASEKLKATWDVIATGTTWLMAEAQWALNAAFLASPIGWVVLGIGAVVGAVMWAWDTFEGFREAIFGIWEAAAQVFGNIADFLGDVFGPIADAVKFALEGDWAAAAGAAAKGMANVLMSPLTFGQAIADGSITDGVADAYALGAEKGRESWAESQKEKDPEKAGNSTGDLNDQLQSNKPSGYQDMPFGGGSRSGKSGSDKGGSSVRNNNIRIEQLVGEIHINNAQGVEGLQTKIKQIVTETLVGAVRDSEVALSSN